MRPDAPFYPECFQALQESPFCRGLNEQQLEDMLRLFMRRTWTRGCRIQADQSRQAFHILIRGRIELTRIHPETGRKITLWFLGPGDGYDIISLLDGREHDIIPLMLDDVETLTTGLDTIRQWILVHPEFNRSFLPYVGRRMRELEDLSTDLALHDTITRLARLILHYVDPEHRSSAGHNYPVRLINDLSHDALASMVGTVRTVVNRHLQQLKKEGAVDFHRGHLAVTNLETLATQAGRLLHRFNKPNQSQH
ncbi:Crp/Fnr family transcriptional regulator [Thermodesulfobacteriota bacterium B35]